MTIKEPRPPYGASRSRILNRVAVVAVAVGIGLLGVLVAAPTPARAAACSPTITTPAGSTDNLVKFTATGTCTWTPPAGLTSVRVLVVGGGGGGGVNIGGGGGGGGAREEAAFAIDEGVPVTVTVGAGGSGGYYQSYNGSDQCAAERDGTNGGSSSFGSLSVLGGGYGLGRRLASSGGSGGGAGGNGFCGTYATPPATCPAAPVSTGWRLPGSGTPGEGYDGSCSGGGGGAGGPGDGRDGGPGRESTITGVSTRYAGGGGLGTCCGASNFGIGGSGGGGIGGTYDPPGNGGANTGGGGGGGGHWASGHVGGSGGTGVVIVRYPTPTLNAPAGADLTYSLTRSQMVAVWNEPTGTGVPVLEYETEIEGTGQTCSTTVATRVCYFAPQVYGDSYRSRTRARSVLGWTAWSAWSATLVPRDVPLRVVGGADPTPGDARITYAWTGWSERGSAITRYDVTASPGGRSCSWTTGDGPLTCAITGLENGRRYTATITATNAIGTSAEYDAGSAVPVTVPDAPRIVLLERGIRQLGVHFELARSSGGSPVLRQEYSYARVGSDDWSAWETRSFYGYGTPVILPGLADSTAYRVRMRAVNAIGPSAPSEPVEQSTYGEPGAPTRVTLAFSGARDIDNDVRVDWSRPAGSTPIDSYEVALADGRSYIVKSGTASWTYIADVVHGVEHRAHVRAHNDVGWGPWSEWSASVLVERVPRPPRFAEFLAGDARLHVVWEQPDGRGRPVLEYEACVYPVQASVGSYDSWGTRCSAGYGAKTCKVSPRASVLGCTFTGLWNRYNYQAVVRARNSLGWSAESWSGEWPTGGPVSELMMPTPLPQYYTTTTGRAKVRVRCLSKEPCSVRVRLSFPVEPYLVYGDWFDVAGLSSADLQVELPAAIRRQLAAGADFIVRIRVETRSGVTSWPEVLPLSAPPADAVGPVTLINRTPTKEFTAVADCDGEGISRCSGTVTLTPPTGARAARVLGRAHVSAGAGERMVLRVELDEAARRLLARRGTLVVRPVVRMSGGIASPVLPVIRFMGLDPDGYAGRAQAIAVLQERERMLALVRAASHQRRNWRDVSRLLLAEVVPGQERALAAADALPRSTRSLNRARALLTRSARLQLSATRGYARWLQTDDVHQLHEATRVDRRARALRNAANRLIRAEQAALG